MVTIFTPTYNRGYIIHQLYESLCAQTSHDFEWLIIDDGSTDDTKKKIETFIREQKIPIQYIYQTNGGKHRAINNGVQQAKGKLFFIVDSDDFLAPDAIENIISQWERIADKNAYAGLCFRRINISTNKIIGKDFISFEFDSTSIELSYIYKIKGDKAEIFRTAILKLFPFPEINGENFVPEALIWNRIAHTGLKLRCINKGIYYCEYLSDGLSKNFSTNLKKNHKGFQLFYKELLTYKIVPFYPFKIKSLIRIIQCYFYKLVQ